MMDWHGVGWVLADEGVGCLSPYRDDLATFAPLQVKHSLPIAVTFRSGTQH